MKYHGYNFDSIKNLRFCIKIFLSKFCACLAIFSAFHSICSNSSIARLRLLTLWCSKNIPVSHSITVSRAPHFLYAITGVPDAIASIGTSPKSSSGGKRNHFA